MSQYINRVTLLGRVTEDPKEIQTPSGLTFTSFPMVTEEKYIRDGEQYKESDFHTVSIYIASVGKFTLERIRQGDLVYVEGKLKVERRDRKGVVSYHAKVAVHQGNRVSLIKEKQDREHNNE